MLITKYASNDIEILLVSKEEINLMHLIMKKYKNDLIKQFGHLPKHYKKKLKIVDKIIEITEN